MSEDRNFSTLASVVKNFVRNEAGFTCEELRRYINQAICDEAVKIWGTLQTLHRETALMDKTRAAIEELENSTADLVRQRHPSAMVDAFDRSYNSNRIALAQVLNYVCKQQAVALEPKTCDWLMQLDYDGMMSQYMDVDVATLYKFPHEISPLQQEGQPTGGINENGADYSREVISEPQRNIAVPKREYDRAAVPLIVHDKVAVQYELEGNTFSGAEDGGNILAATKYTVRQIQSEQEQVQRRNDSPPLG